MSRYDWAWWWLDAPERILLLPVLVLLIFVVVFGALSIGKED